MGEALKVTACETLRQGLQRALETAEAGGETGRVNTIRLIQCAVRDRDAAARREDRCTGCEAEDITEVLRAMAAERLAAADVHEREGHLIEAERERAEADFIGGFLPQPLADRELRAAVAGLVTDLQAKGLKDVGRCVNALKQRYPGRVDPTVASAEVRRALAG